MSHNTTQLTHMCYLCQRCMIVQSSKKIVLRRVGIYMMLLHKILFLETKNI